MVRAAVRKAEEPASSSNSEDYPTVQLFSRILQFVEKPFKRLRHYSKSETTTATLTVAKRSWQKDALRLFTPPFARSMCDFSDRYGQNMNYRRTVSPPYAYRISV
uniref:Uncharacterized protein n=1 Tax=Vespula pensylvanica TaxID=30213 RepID=A0A834UGM8_VESPE|nr:hypothetical protein H0235_001282 [Vespula pensylvanica]